MRTKASIKGHPIHPMLVTFPIALFITSLVADGAYLYSGEVFWYDFAWWTMAFGILGALLAAVPGLVDYRTAASRRAETRRIGLAHMIINLSVVGLYVINLALRWNYNAAVGVSLGMVMTLSGLAVLALGVSGWLGGSMVYKHRVGVTEDGVRITRIEEERARTRQ